MTLDANHPLAGHEITADPHGFFLWLRLPEPWRSSEFAAEVERRLVDEPPALLREGAVIRDGLDPELDALRDEKRVRTVGCLP